MPVERLADFMDVFAREVPIEPVWFCPLQQRRPEAAWPLYPLDPAGSTSTSASGRRVALEPGEADGTPQPARRAAGRRPRRPQVALQHLRSTSREEFWPLYGGAAYAALKKTYDPDGRLLDLYAKCVQQPVRGRSG